MAVKIRMKRMGRRHRPFYRICAADSRSPRDGRVIEELGTYDPMTKETDARVHLNNERVEYWLSVGAKPSPAVHTLIKKYGANGTHLEAREQALERMKIKSQAPPPVVIPKAKPEAAQAEAKTEEKSADQPAEDAKATDAQASDAEASEAPATEDKAADATGDDNAAESGDASKEKPSE